MSQQGRLIDAETNLETLTGNTGGPVEPDGAGNIDILGDAPYTVTGNPGTHTLTISDDGTVPLTFTEDSGTATATANNLNVFGEGAQGSVTSGAGSTITITNSDASTIQKGVTALAEDSEAIAGTNSTKTIVPSSLKAKLGSQTQFGLSYGNTTTSAIAWTAAGTNGQIPIAATGASPAFASLTSTGGTIDFTTGANSLNLETAAEIATSYDTDAGTAVPALGVLTVVGSGGVTTSGAGSTVTIDGSGISSVSLSPYIVGTTGSSDFSTISAAITQAVLDGASATSPANIYIKPGTYNENLTLVDGINLIGFTGTADTDTVTFSTDTQVLSVNVTGVLNLASGQVKIYDIQITPGSATTVFNIASGSDLDLLVKNCYIYNINANNTLFEISANTSSAIILDGVQSRAIYSSFITFDSGQTNSTTINLINSTYGSSTATTVPANTTLGFLVQNAIFRGGFDVESGGNFSHTMRNSSLNLPTTPYITASAAADVISSCEFTNCVLPATNFDINTANSSLVINFDECSLGAITFDTTIPYVKTGCTESDQIVHKMIAAAGLDSYSGSDWFQVQAGVQTTDDTETTLSSVTVNEGEAITLKGTISAAESDHSNALGGDFLIIARREAAGNITLVGTATTNVQSSSAATFTVDVDTGTQTVRIRVTGIAATTYNWVTTYQYQKILTDA